MKTLKLKAEAVILYSDQNITCCMQPILLLPLVHQFCSFLWGRSHLYRHCHEALCAVEIRKPARRFTADLKTKTASSVTALCGVLSIWVALWLTTALDARKTAMKQPTHGIPHIYFQYACRDPVSGWRAYHSLARCALLAPIHRYSDMVMYGAPLAAHLCPGQPPRHYARHPD